MTLEHLLKTVRRWRKQKICTGKAIRNLRSWGFYVANDRIHTFHPEFGFLEVAGMSDIFKHVLTRKPVLPCSTNKGDHSERR